MQEPGQPLFGKATVISSCLYPEGGDKGAVYFYLLGHTKVQSGDNVNEKKLEET